MKFTLSANDEDIRSVTFEFQSYDLDDTLNHLEDFLKSVGFDIEGKLNIEPNYWGWNDYGDEEQLSLSIDWTVDQILKNEKTQKTDTSINNKSLCPICKLNVDEMQNNKCWDTQCPL